MQCFNCIHVFNTPSTVVSIKMAILSRMGELFHQQHLEVKRCSMYVH